MSFLNGLHPKSKFLAIINPLFYFMNMKTIGRFIAFLCAAVVAAPRADSALVTYYVSGVFNGTNPVVNPGDTFSGSFTFEGSAVPTSSSNPSLDIQVPAINSSLLGTGWQIDVDSSAVAPFSMTGNNGVISLGNNVDPTGDRYILTLSGAGPLPLGGSLNFFQIDLQDPVAQGQNLLADGSFTSLPNLAAAWLNSGRFFTTGYVSGSAQLPISLTQFSASPVPEPNITMLFGLGLLGLLFRRRK